MPPPDLELAKRAIQFVKDQTMRASNREWDRLAWEGPGTLDEAVLEGEMAFMLGEDAAEYHASEKLTTKKWAEIALACRAGNCEVQSRLAFDWLARLPPGSLPGATRPKLELMSLQVVSGKAYPASVQLPITGAQVDFNEPDHVFIVIGRTQGDIRDFRTWNEDAVICDPWAKRAYLVTQLEEEMDLIRMVSGGETRTVQKLELLPGQQW